MTASGHFRYRAVASNESGTKNAPADVTVDVSAASLEAKSFTINNPELDVGETVTFKITTGKLASSVSILDASNMTFASSSKPSKTTSTQKIWTIQHKLTEDDMDSFTLHARIDSKYGAGPDSATQVLKVTDSLPRIISVTADKAALKRETELKFTVVTNAAATCVWVSNDKNEKWQQTTVVDSSLNQQTWQVTALPRQLGSRKFYAQAYRGAFPGLKVFARKILVIK
jgi:hypothetical protein